MSSSTKVLPMQFYYREQDLHMPWLPKTRWFMNTAFTIVSLVGAAPLYASAWLCTQAALQEYRFPAAAYVWMDRLMYREYQELVRLMYQHWMGIKVRMFVKPIETKGKQRRKTRAVLK